MKKLLLSIATITLLVSCGGEQNTPAQQVEITQADTTAQKEAEEVCKKGYDKKATTIGFGGFKTTGKVEVKGHFKKFTVDSTTVADTPEEILGPDLLKKDELELQPGSKLEYKMSLNRNTRFIGVVLAYRDIEKARWRSVIEVDPTGYDDIDVNVESLATYMR